MKKLSAIIICNPEWYGTKEHLSECLKSLDWCEEIVLCVSSRPKWFVAMIEEYQNTRMVDQIGDNFAAWRNGVIDQVDAEWVLFVDADEVVTEALRDEILGIIGQSETISAYSIPRSNRIMGKFLQHGGWYPDYVLRLLKLAEFEGYMGELHEQPKISGEVGYLQSPFLHYKHNDIESMVDKTNQWSVVEAELMYEANHPPMNVRRFVRPMVTTFWSRYVVKKGFLDGTHGLIDAIYQSYSVAISYAKLWERQQKSK